MNLHDLFAIPRQRTPDKIAIHALDASPAPTSLTFAELYQAVDRLAAGLQRWGVRKGDRVAFYLGSRPELIIAYLAVIRLGAVVVPINLRYRRLEIGHILSDCTPRLLVTERAQLGYLEEVGAEKASLEAQVLAEELDQWQADAAALQLPLVESVDGE